MKRSLLLILMMGGFILCLATGSYMIRQSHSIIPQAFSLLQAKENTSDSDSDKVQTLYQQMVQQVDDGNYYSATHTYLSGGKSLAAYPDASSYYFYARALFYYHNKTATCLGQPLSLLNRIPDFLSSASYRKKMEELVSPYEGTYLYTDARGIKYRISIKSGLVSYDVVTRNSQNLGNYQNQLILVPEADQGQRMYSANLNYTDYADLNYSLVLQKDGSLQVTKAEQNSFDTFVGLYAKTSNNALESH